MLRSCELYYPFELHNNHSVTPSSPRRNGRFVIVIPYNCYYFYFMPILTFKWTNLWLHKRQNRNRKSAMAINPFCALSSCVDSFDFLSSQGENVIQLLSTCKNACAQELTYVEDLLANANHILLTRSTLRRNALTSSF